MQTSFIGPLFLKNGTEVPYRIYGRNSSSIGIVTFVNLDLSDQVTLKPVSRDTIPMTVFRKSQGPSSGTARFELRLTRDHDIDALSQLIPGSKDISSQPWQEIRVPTQPPIVVSVHSFGGDSLGDMRTANISRTGILLEARPSSQLNSKTLSPLVICEITALAPWVQHDIKAMGRITRQFPFKDRDLKGVAVNFINLNQQDAMYWADTVRTVETANFRNAKPT